MGLGLRGIAVVAALLLAGGGARPAATLAQEATPAAGATAQREIEIPDARILALSPDGQRLAARTPDAGRPEHLCVYEVPTLTEIACGNLDERRIAMSDESVVWAPDSTKIAFGEDAFRTFRDGDLWTMDAATGNITNRTDDGFEGGVPLLGADEDLPATPIYIDVVPAWAPDSRSITFSRSPIIDGDFRGNQIVRVDLASGQVETLLAVSLDLPGLVYWGLTWAPDGQTLYYSAANPDPDDPQNGVWSYDSATGQAQQILKSDPERGTPALMRVSATGSTGIVVYPLAMSQFDPTGEVIVLLDLETGATSPVHPVPADPANPAYVATAAFSPDGTRVLYGLRAVGRGRLLVRPLSAEEPELVVDGPIPFPTTFGSGLYWADDGTVFASTDLSTGMLLALDPGQAPDIPSVGPSGPGASPVASDADALQPGATATLAAEAPLRATPSDNGTVVIELRPGATLTIIGEPVEAGGSTWVPVVEPATGTIGYVDAALLE